MADLNTSSDSKSVGLVKQLLFPGFADSGASETYRHGDNENDGDSSSSSEASTVVQNNLSLNDEDEDEGGNEGGENFLFETPISTLDNASEGDFSEASTQIRNNLSGIEQIRLLDMNKPVSTVTRSTTPPNVAIFSNPNPPSFFASTKPTVVHQSSPPLGPESSPPKLSPESPPKLPRRTFPPNTRNISTVADAGSDGGGGYGYSANESISTTNRKNPLLAVNDPGWDDKTAFGFLNPSEEKRDEASMTPTPVPVPPATPAFTPPLPSSSKSPTMLGDDNTEQQEQNQLLSEAKLLDHDKGDGGGGGANDDYTPVQIQGQGEEPVWEEEATPAQTAFGKELMFNRKENRQAMDGQSDVYSTASEMGTIVGTGQRMADLEDMETNSPIPSASLDAESEYPPDVWVDESLSLPMLEVDTKKIPQLELDASRISEVQEEKKVPDMDISPDRIASDSEAAPEGTTTGMLSMAMRRIGSGLTGGGTNQRGTVSAPSTPRGFSASPLSRWDRIRPSPRTPRGSDEASATPQSFLLRSPGSSANIAANSNDSKRFTLSPRFSIWNKDISPNKHRDRPRNFANIPEDEITQEETERETALSKQRIPFQIARSCLSMDAYDTSMDDQYEFTLPDIEAREMRESLEHSQRWLETRERTGNVESVLRNSKSWDIAGASQASAFRPARHVRDRRITSPSEFKRNPFDSPGKGPRRVRILSDFSPAANKDMAMELKIPHRIEIEREDALDILSCLVERGASLHEVEAEVEGAKDKSEGAADRGTSEDPKAHVFGALDVSSVADDLRSLSNARQRKDSSAGIENEHTVRMLVLDELVRSHEYALEMSRAAQSASSWLTSIGRPLSTKNKTRQDSSSGTTKRAANDGSGVQTAGETASERIDLLMTKAMLHTAQIEAKEEREKSLRLNEELAKCRAEIGRLKTAPVPFKSPNRSILDETNDEDESDVEDGVIDRSFENASPIGRDGESSFVQSSFLFAPDPIEPNDKLDDQASMRIALDEANEIIRKLHSDLKSSNQAESVPEEPPTVQVNRRDRQSESPGNKDERTVNVRMLDGENFVTDWDDLAPPLPPPPDHGLRSPIVAAVLEQWTSEGSLHESLLSWIDQVLAGGDPVSIPPLTISSLDHQVRDGFSMHVLPLLLRRPDIRVDVQTRAHRRTTYDIAVGVESISPRAPFDVRRHLESTSGRSDIGGTSVTHSSTTALITNGILTIPSIKTFSDEYESRMGITSGLSYDEMAEGMGAGDQQAPGIMSALGGALGGLLTRRKPVIPDNTSDVGSMAAMHDSPAAGMAQEFGFTADGQEDDQPYHRVVSAPPGRIGVTFVEYRGHAMVSDVAPDSPLCGWIFPSDILIAIDELPVSGMRVRAIITVLKDRKDRQRALRVISSHDMNEFTNASVVLDTSTS